MTTLDTVAGPHIWNAVPIHVREELHPILSRILVQNLAERERDGLLAYCIYYHLHVVAAGQRKVLEKTVVDAATGPSRSKNKNLGANSGLGAISRSPLSRENLAATICDIAAETELLKLLGDRGPDYGLSLLILLELLFQVAFCLRRQRETNTEALTAMSYCSRLLEIIALHLDSPPVWPRFTLKFGMTVTGLVYHRKIQSPAAARLFQLNYFLFPQTRKYLLGPGELADDDDGRGQFNGGGPTPQAPSGNGRAPLPVLSPTFTHTLLDPKVEETLWHLVKDLALEQPSPKTVQRVAAGERPDALECRIDAMALVFERLHHLARQLFGADLYLYGSGATGFATVNSDIDVVVHLTAEQEERLISDAREAQKTLPDLNLFPAYQNSGGNNTALQMGLITGMHPLVGDWNWLEEKNRKTAAAIWLNRKIAWACYRLYGWSVQCVQSAYVPIVRILAAVDAQTAMPCELPAVFMPDHPYGLTLGSLLKQVDSQSRSMGTVRNAHSLDNMLLLISLTRRMSVGTVKKYVARTVAYEIVSEVLYASWKPSLSAQTSFEEANLYMIAREETPQIVEIEDKLVRHFYVYWTYLKERTQDGSFQMLNPRAISPVLLPAKPAPNIDDGRLSAIQGASHDLYIVEADISVGRQVGIHNSRLLRAYARVDPRVIALGLLVKQWARACSLEDAYNGYLSGYQWTLIVIHFLQHYCCLPVPTALETRAEWRSLLASFRHAQCGFSPHHLPLLPNLQNPVSNSTTMPNLHSKGPLTINEVEGDLDVWFYEPHLGSNETVEDGSYWPENTVLKTHPLLYGYMLLSAPFNLQEIAEKLSESTARTSEQSRTANSVLTNVLQSLKQTSKTTPEIEAALWTMRLHSCPRPHIERLCDGESTPVNNSASKTLTPHILWDAQRANLKERLSRTWSEEKRQTARSPFPDLTPLRDKTFVQQHVMERTDSLIESFRCVKGEPTLAELLFGFFEYFGTRLNYATDMIDTARTPQLPRGKKEWFKTSIFDPDFEEEGGGIVGPKEVAGRGNGPFQFRGRHFLCLRDPMEKLRTVGPPYRCQTMITKSLAGSITALSFINRMTDRTAVKASLEEMFVKQPGLTPSVLRNSSPPVRQCLREYIDSQIKHFSSAMTSSETQDCRVMYNGLRHMILENGNYRNLNGNGNPTPGPTERPVSFAHQPQIGTKGAIIETTQPAYRRHSLTTLASPAPPPRGSLPKASASQDQGPARTSPRPVPDARLLAPPVPPLNRCTSLPTENGGAGAPATQAAPPKKTRSPSSCEKSVISSSDASSASSSGEAPPSVSDAASEEKYNNNQSVVEKFKDSQLSWCMKPASFRRLQNYLRLPSVTAEGTWQAAAFEDPIHWLETSTGIKRFSKFRHHQAVVAPPIRSIRSRQAADAESTAG